MDCGTTNIKALILRNDGKVIAEDSRASTFLQPGPHMQEQDAKDW
ncbi:MAG: FGGY family carbohydrate kinase, partial [Oscillospiraceae bacterium]|nr:FGGY family carbohydrate kinase [Oscillospiraceae bacterium]